MDYTIIFAALGILAALVVWAVLQEKRGKKDHPCTGCPNYSNCRAHVGCSNNINRKKK